MINKIHSMAIASVRVQLGLTQQQLANDLGISRSLVGMVETNRRSLPAKAKPLFLGMQKIALNKTFTGQGKERTAQAHTRVYNRIGRSTGLARHSTASFNAANISRLPGQPAIKPGKVQQELSGYSLQLLKNRTDCEGMIHNFSMHKESLECQLQYLQLEKQAAASKSLELAGQWNLLNALLEAGRQIITKYPAGKVMKKWEIRNAKHHYKKLLLEQKMEHFNAIAILQREHHIQVIERQLELTNHLIHTVRERMEELAQGGSLQ